MNPRIETIFILWGETVHRCPRSEAQNKNSAFSRSIHKRMVGGCGQNLVLFIVQQSDIHHHHRQ